MVSTIFLSIYHGPGIFTEGDKSNENENKQTDKVLALIELTFWFSEKQPQINI